MKRRDPENERSDERRKEREEILRTHNYEAVLYYRNHNK